VGVGVTENLHYILYEERKMKKIVVACVTLLFSALLFSCVEIQVSDVGRIHIKNLEVP
jgi:hypothetical protein